MVIKIESTQRPALDRDREVLLDDADDDDDNDEHDDGGRTTVHPCLSLLFSGNQSITVFGSPDMTARPRRETITAQSSAHVPPAAAEAEC